MFATIALFSWPVVVAVLFTRLSRPLAVTVSLLGGYLLLPTKGGINLPMLPSLEKFSIPALSVLLMMAVMRPRADDPPARPGLLPEGLFPRLLLLSIIVGAFMTVLTNRDPLQYGPLTVSGLRTYDAFSSVLQTALIVLPLLLARKYLGHPNQQTLLLKALCIAALWYSLLALYEIRMSPQLNHMIYGFFPHSWIQHVRGGGYRPIVFLGHGLQLAILFAGAIIAAIGLFRIEDESKRTFYLFAILWLAMMLVLGKSLGALVIAMAFAPVVLFLRARQQIMVAMVVTVFIISYPFSRSAGLVPTEWIQSVASSYDPYRGASLGTRLENEERLLEHTSSRPIFGWGGWGRNRVYSETGANITITDGYWIIAFAAGGWVRFLSEFLLLGAPMILLYLRRKRLNIGRETAVLAIIGTAWIVDLLPNSALTVPLWMIAGSLWGRLEFARVDDPVAPDSIATQTRGLTYTRMPPKPRNPVRVPSTRYTRESGRTS